jgi:hypothetical protein
VRFRPTAASCALALAAGVLVAHAPARVAHPRTTAAVSATTYTPVSERLTAPTGWPVTPDALTPLVGDFNGDGRSDVLEYGPGALPDHLWLGRTDDSYDGVPISVGGSYAPVVADFDGDGRSDVLWYAAGSTADFVWYGAPHGKFGSLSVSVGGAYTPLAGDFDGDNRTDLLWYGPGAQRDVLWLHRRTKRGFVSRSLTVGGTYRPVIGDYDANGADDILWYGYGAAPDALWLGTATARFVGKTVRVGGAYDPVVADFNGDHYRDVLWYGPGTTPDVIWYGRPHGKFAGASYAIDQRGVPVAGNFNGDAYRDVIVYGAGGTVDGVFYGRHAAGLDRGSISLSGAYRPVSGDFNGDGRDDVFWYSPGDGLDKIGYGLGRSFYYRPTTIDIGFTRAVPLRQTTFQNAFNPYGFVAHEMGGISGNTYTNSRDAFELNYARGFRVFECDQVILADGTVLVAHDGLERYYGLNKPFEDATWAELSGHQFGGRYGIMRAQDIVQLLRDHPDIYVILDFKDQPDRTFAQYLRITGGDRSLVERLFPHIADATQLRAVRRKYPVQNYVVSLYNSQAYGKLDDPAVVDWVRRDRIPSLMMWQGQRDRSISLTANHKLGQRYDARFVASLWKAGAVSYVHTLDDKLRGQTLSDRRTGMYTNVLFPPFEQAPPPPVETAEFRQLVAEDGEG